MALKSIAQAPGTTGRIDEDFARDSTKIHLALFDRGDDEFFVLTNSGIRINTPHPSDPMQLVTGIAAELLEAQTTDQVDNTAASLWRLTVDYGLWNPLEHSPDGNPLNMPVRFRLDFTTVNQPAWVDVDGNPIVNAAGDYYDPPVEREVLRATLTVLRNEVNVQPATLAALCNVVNAATWNGFPPKTVKLNPPKLPFVSYSQVSGQFYWPMEYVFDVNFDTWIKQILNQGYRQLDAGGNLVPIFVNGQPLSNPVMLDESGKALLTPDDAYSGGDTPTDSNPGGTPSDPPGGGEPPEGGTGASSSSRVIVNAYEIYRTLDFGQLNMPNLFTLPSLGGGAGFGSPDYFSTDYFPDAFGG